MEPELHPTRTTPENARKRKKQLSLRQKEIIERYGVKLYRQVNNVMVNLDIA